ncbi:MAG: hypothetical protein [Thorarchaeia virus VerdaV2]|uniref:Uncharacterized protein n=1 Tax=Thorarchaeia virus VerdaV2 TaxID=3070171 RepID=A0AA35CNN7_9CAUD|nr:MAG: hypothetical protein QIT42_gp23 [Thorarchaeia virus VerdaV2]BDI54917.1 MAG: hypothetical protein [Thorarchaeia virus VerdaV2]
MIRVTLKIPLDPYSFIEIYAKASSPTKIMDSLEAMIRAINNKVATAFWDKYFRFNETKFIAPGEKTSMVKTIEKTIMKGKETPAAVNLDARYNYLDKSGHPRLCNKCHGFISWDKYPAVGLPIHVDKEGKAIGDGSCPDFE